MDIIAAIRSLFRRHTQPTRAQIVQRLKTDAIRDAQRPLRLELVASPAMVEDLEALSCHMNVDTGTVLTAGVMMLAAISREGRQIECFVPSGRGSSRRIIYTPDPRRKPPRGHWWKS